MSDISELREWANNKIKLYDKMAVAAPHLYASDVSRSMLHQVVELCDKMAWHYPSKGELPEKGGEYLVKVNYHDGNTPPFMSICEFDTKYQKWCFYGNKDIIAWRHIVPPREEDDE